jgi:hypothetical protein
VNEEISYETLNHEDGADEAIIEAGVAHWHFVVDDVVSIQQSLNH